MERRVVTDILARVEKGPPLLQVIVGPRQVGKTTAARTVGSRWPGPVRYAAADFPVPPGPEWIYTQWGLARNDRARGLPLLILDEVQKVDGWSEAVKSLRDEDMASGTPFPVLLLGSSSLLLAKGITESLAGRFFLHRCSHWSYPECREAFDWDLPRWIYFGGYPGAAPLSEEQDAWRAYITDSLVETVLARDVIAMQTIRKPTLLRHLFGLATRFPAQILSYNKMLGQLTDAGNTTTLAEYVRMLETAFLLSGLEKYSAGKARVRGSSPKLVLWNNALVNALNLTTFEGAQTDGGWWGRLVENAVGAHLMNYLQGMPWEVTYWRDRGQEVDFVVQGAHGVLAIEVKSGTPRKPKGLSAFLRRFPNAKPLIVGAGGMPLEEFFSTDPRKLA